MAKACFRCNAKDTDLTGGRSFNIAKDVGQALRHAHDRGVIHRDLKPGNLLRSTAGENKITDFGIAKSFGSSQNTGENVLGTMDFMSPEQAKGQPVTARSDLYSLGTVLFTLLSGKPPFKANSVEESLRNLTKVPPACELCRAHVPDEIDKLIRQLMDKDPNKRIPTAHALLIKIAEIEQLLKDYSEAKTAFNPPVAETFEIRAGGRRTDHRKVRDKSEPAKSRRTVHQTTVDGRKRAGSTRGEKASRLFQHRYRTAKATAGCRGSAGITKTQSRNDLPLSICLLAVVLIGGYGMLSSVHRHQLTRSTKKSKTAFRHRTSFARKLPNSSRPTLTMIASHTSDSSMESPNQSPLPISCSVRSRMANSRLSEIERQFLDIVNLAGTIHQPLFLE